MALRSSFWQTSIGMVKIGKHITAGDITGKVVYYETCDEGTDDQRIVGVETMAGTLIRLKVERRDTMIYRRDTDEVIHWSVR